MADMAQVLQAMAAAKEAAATQRQARAARPVVRTSTCEAPVATVWRVAGAMLAADPKATRADVHAACEAAGVATLTARTQVQAFAKAAKAAGWEGFARRG